MSESLSEFLARLQARFRDGLFQASKSYLSVGLFLFHENIEDPYNGNTQVALGNISIGLELLIKGYLAEQNLLMVVKDIPIELRAFLSVPDRLPDTYNWRRWTVDLIGKQKLFEFDECVTNLKQLTTPDEAHQLLGASLKNVVAYRNLSVHNVLPKYHRGEVSATVYAGLKLILWMHKQSETTTWNRALYTLSEEDSRFLETFQIDRTNKVRKAVTSATSRATTATPVPLELNPADYHQFRTPCPVCHNHGILTGDTERRRLPGNIGMETLTFMADTFTCPTCQLTLDSSEEMKSITMEVTYDRGVEFVDLVNIADLDWLEGLTF